VPAGAGTVPPASELTFFLDRNLGSQIVPGALRAAGWVLETMDERYGIDESKLIQDVQWIEEATLAGDVLLTKDVRIAKNPLEATAVYRTSARVFALASGMLTGPEMAAWFLAGERSIFRMASHAGGPYVAAITRGNTLRRLTLNRL
jgi:PIN like domain